MYVCMYRSIDRSIYLSCFSLSLSASRFWSPSLTSIIGLVRREQGGGGDDGPLAGRSAESAKAKQKMRTLYALARSLARS